MCSGAAVANEVVVVDQERCTSEALLRSPGSHIERRTAPDIPAFILAAKARQARLVSLQVASRYKAMSQPALFPGYKHVEAFGADDEYESKDGVVEEEVEYVTLDLGSVEPTLVPSSSSYRLIVSPRVVYPHSMCSHAFDA